MHDWLATTNIYCHSYNDWAEGGNGVYGLLSDGQKNCLLTILWRSVNISDNWTINVSTVNLIKSRKLAQYDRCRVLVREPVDGVLVVLSSNQINITTFVHQMGDTNLMNSSCDNNTICFMKINYMTNFSVFFKGIVKFFFPNHWTRVIFVISWHQMHHNITQKQRSLIYLYYYMI